MGLVAPRHVGSSWIRSNPCLLHWQVDSLPLSYQGKPIGAFKCGFSLSPHWNLHPRAGECWSKGSSAGSRLVSATVEVQAVCTARPVQAPAIVSLGSAAAWAPSILHPSQSVTAPGLNHTPFPCGATPEDRQGPTWTLSMHWVVSWGGRATLRALGCFWCTAWVSINHGTATPPDLPWVWGVSGSLTYVFSSVVAALDPTHHDVKSERGWNIHSTGLGHAPRKQWETQQSLDHVLLPVLGISQCACAPQEQNPGFSQLPYY